MNKFAGRSSTALARKRAFGGAAVVLAAALALTACSSSGTGGSSASPSGPVNITVWAQQGQPGEVKAAQAETASFNASQTGIKATLKLLPQATYDQTIATTAISQLPDVIEINGETLGSMVYAKKVVPLTGLVSAANISNQLSSLIAEGTYPGDNKYYAIAQYDSGLALYGNKKLLDAAGIKYPTTWQAAWTFPQFKAAVVALAAKNKSGYGLDIKENYAGTWPGYAFTPIVNGTSNPAQAGTGFELVHNDKATGSLNAPAVAANLAAFATLRKYSDPSADDSAFTNGRAGLAWVGHWAYPTLSKALGANLVVIPLPNFGNGSKSGQGSHSWVITSNSKSAQAAAKYLDWVTADAQIKAVTDANGAVPGSKTAVAASPLYKQGGPLYLYAQQLAASCGTAVPTPSCVTVPRTISPAWPVINTAFSQAFWNIWKGGNAQSELNKAAQTIDQAYSDNNNYK